MAQRSALYTHRVGASLLACAAGVVLPSIAASAPAWAQGGKDHDADAGASSPTSPPPEDETVDLSNEPDLVKSLGASPSVAPQPLAPVLPPRPDRFEFRGFTRLTAGAGLFSFSPEVPGAAPQERVPYDRGFVEQHLHLDLRYAHGGWFRAVVSGSISLAGFYQNNQASSGNPGSATDVGRLDAIAREVYVGFTLGQLDLRIGQQRIVWGNSFAYGPNDILNGRDLRNPFLFDAEMIELPSPAVRADLDFGPGVVGLVFEPFIPSDRLDLYGTNWALVQADAPAAYRRLFGTLAQGNDRNTVQALQETLSGGALGGSNPVNASLGASLKLHFGGVDVSYYFNTGFDRQPAVYVDPAFQKQLESLDPAQLNAGVLDAILNQSRASTKAIGGPLQVSYRRREHVGVDFQTTTGSFVLRGDAAYDSAKTFYAASSFNSSIRPAVQEVLGIEYQTGDIQKVIGLEAWSMQILSPEIHYVPALDQGTSGKLLWYDDVTYGVSALVRWKFLDVGVVDLRSSIGVSPFWWSVRPEVGYQSEASTFTVRGGLLVLDGTDGAFGDWYRRNTTAYVTSRVSF
jgi:hypothetical protein